MSIHPLDFDALNKGDVIDQDQIERIYNIRHATDSDRYRLVMLKLREEIELNRKDLLVRCRGTRLEVMTDPEAEGHTVDRHEKLVTATVRNVRKRARIDRSEFSHEQQKRAESWDRSMTAVALMARKQLAAEKREQLLLGQPQPEPEPAK